MKRLFFSLRLSLFPVTGIFLVMMLSGCLKDKDNSNNNVPVSGLMAFNLAPDKSAVAFSLSGNSLTQSPLSYTNYSGGYQSIYTGNRNVESFDYNTNSTIATETHNFEANKYYSVFLIGANDSYKNIVADDNLDSLSSTSGQAYIRYINAIPDSTGNPVVTITAKGSDVFNGGASFSTVSDFRAVSPGDVKIAVSNGGTISANRNITVEDKKIYTVLLIGIPGESDPIKSVQIKFIQNGTLSSDMKQ